MLEHGHNQENNFVVVVVAARCCSKIIDRQQEHHRKLKQAPSLEESSWLSSHHPIRSATPVLEVTASRGRKGSAAAAAAPLPFSRKHFLNHFADAPQNLAEDSVF